MQSEKDQFTKASASTSEMAHCHCEADLSTDMDVPDDIMGRVVADALHAVSSSHVFQKDIMGDGDVGEGGTFKDDELHIKNREDRAVAMKSTEEGGLESESADGGSESDSDDVVEDFRLFNRSQEKGQDKIVVDAIEAEDADEGNDNTDDNSNTKEEDYCEEHVTPLGPSSRPCGPSDPSILLSFDTHVAKAIWDGQDRGPIKCIHHVSKIFEWDLTKESSLFNEKVRATPLFVLTEVSYKHINRILVSAFVERWHSETNTFHLPFGEMTITLDDVQQITGLPVFGEPLGATEVRRTQAEALLVKWLGVSEQEACTELSNNKCNYVRMEWLRKKLSGTKDSHPMKKIDQAVRGYLLYLMGCSLFADKTGTKVPVMYLQLLKDIPQIHTYAWGAGGLTYLYRQLGRASSAQVKQIAGYLTLLEAWVYEHFALERPTPDMSFSDKLPRARRWKPRAHVCLGEAHNSLRFFRESLDNLKREKVIWDPYRSARPDRHFPQIAWYYGCIRFCDVVEPYHSDRVLRQFGHVQGIPGDPIPPERVTRGHKASSFEFVFSFVDHHWRSWKNHLLAESKRGPPCQLGWECEVGYDEWFGKISQTRVHPTTSNVIWDTAIESNLHSASTKEDWQSVRDAVLQIVDKTLLIGMNQDKAHLLHNMLQVRDILRMGTPLPSDVVPSTLRAAVISHKLQREVTARTSEGVIASEDPKQSTRRMTTRGTSPVGGKTSSKRPASHWAGKASKKRKR